MDIKFILNDALNKALINKGRIKGVASSNKIGDFVNKYIETEQLLIHDVVKPLKDKKTIGFPAWRKLNKIKKVKGMYTYKGIEQNGHCLWLIYRHETKQDL